MYELRVLNGYHRGATLPLDERTHIIGADDDADVVLVDPGVSERHAALTLTSSGWKLEMLDGEVRGAENNHVGDLELRMGDFARVGDVWVCVAKQTDAWNNPPPVPVDEPEVEEEPEPEMLAAEDDEDQDQDDAYDYEEEDEEEAAPAYAAEADDDYPDFVDEDVEEEHVPVHAALEDEISDEELDENASKRSRSVIFVPIAIAAILSAAAAYAMSAHNSDNTNKLHSRGSLASLDVSNTKIATDLRNTPLGADGNMGDKLGSAAPAKTLSPEALRAAFRKRLAEVDLLSRFNLELTDDEWRMQAALDHDEAGRFERIMKAFAKEYNLTVPVHAEIGTQEAMLPFKIKQVISGSDASIVTDNGTRLYIGDEYQGMRLAAIDRNRISFSGKRNLDVTW